MIIGFCFVSCFVFIKETQGFNKTLLYFSVKPLKPKALDAVTQQKSYSLNVYQQKKMPYLTRQISSVPGKTIFLGTSMRHR